MATVDASSDLCMNDRWSRSALPLAIVVLLPAVLIVVRLVVNPILTSDDAFFLDAGFAWMTERRLALPLWGQGLGHATFLASYPPVMPLISSIDSWALVVTGTLLGAKITDVALIVATSWLFWNSLNFIGRPWLRAAVTLAVLLDPLVSTYYASLRPEALLIPLVFALFMASHRIIERERCCTVAAAVSGAGLALTHWQFAPSVFYAGVALLAAARVGRIGWRPAIAYWAATSVAYGTYVLYIVLDSTRRAIFVAQLSAAGGTSPFVQRIRLFVGTMFAGNVESGSIASLLLLLAVVIAIAQVKIRAFRSGDQTAWSAPYTLGFLIVSVLPALSLPYVGPRIVPLFLVAAWVVVRAAAGRAAPLLAIAAPIVAVLNVAGDLALRAGYNHETGPSLWLQKSWLWLALSVFIWAASRRQAPVLARNAVLAGALAIGLATSLTLMTPAGVLMNGSNIKSMQTALAVVPPDVPVLCDSTTAYIPLRIGHPNRQIFTTFPLFYFRGMFDTLFSGMNPAVILVSDTVRVQIRNVQPAGRQLEDQLRQHFALSTSFEVGGGRTWVYVRTPPQTVRAAVSRR
jgi:hypothetical protein